MCPASWSHKINNVVSFCGLPFVFHHIIASALLTRMKVSMSSLSVVCWHNTTQHNMTWHFHDDKSFIHNPPQVVCHRNALLVLLQTKCGPCWGDGSSQSVSQLVTICCCTGFWQCSILVQWGETSGQTIDRSKGIGNNERDTNALTKIKQISQFFCFFSLHKPTILTSQDVTNFFCSMPDKLTLFFCRNVHKQLTLHLHIGLHKNLANFCSLQTQHTMWLSARKLVHLNILKQEWQKQQWSLLLIAAREKERKGRSESCVGKLASPNNNTTSSNSNKPHSCPRADSTWNPWHLSHSKKPRRRARPQQVQAETEVSVVWCRTSELTFLRGHQNGACWFC